MSKKIMVGLLVGLMSCGLQASNAHVVDQKLFARAGQLLGELRIENVKPEAVVAFQQAVGFDGKAPTVVADKFDDIFSALGSGLNQMQIAVMHGIEIGQQSVKMPDMSGAINRSDLTYVSRFAQWSPQSAYGVLVLLSLGTIGCGWQFIRDLRRAKDKADQQLVYSK